MTGIKMTMQGVLSLRPDFFHGIALPAGIERDLVAEAIMLQAGECEILYSDPDFFKEASRHWFSSHRYTFETMIKSMDLDFNALHNYDRYEDIKDSSESHSESHASGDSSLTSSVAAYDSISLQTASGDATESHTDGTTGGTNENTHTAHIYGNIGVTTAAQMLAELRDLADFSIYDEIAKRFCHRFILEVY